MSCKDEKSKLIEEFKKFPKTIKKKELTQWLIEKQKVNRSYCTHISIIQLINTAEKCGIKVIL